MPWYRTQVTRWALILTGMFLAVSFSPAGPTQWRDTPSLRLLHHLLPWPVICALFTVYTVLMLTGGLRAAIFACFLGLGLYGCEFFALLLKLDVHQKTNPFAIGGVFLACVLHFAAGRLAVYEKEGA